MGQAVRLTSGEDGFPFDAWHVAAAEARRGGLVILHAIWGVTPHLRELAESYAAIGYEVLIPSLFDRFHRGFPQTNVDEAVRARQMSYGEATGWGAGVLDAVQAAIDWLKPPVFAMGFCYGGTAAWLAASRCMGLSAAAAYYGGQIALYLDEKPRTPTLLHLGRSDPLIPMEDVERIRTAYPDLPLHLYDAGHAFVAPGPDHRPEAARLAQLRTLQLFTLNSGGRGEN